MIQSIVLNQVPAATKQAASNAITFNNPVENSLDIKVNTASLNNTTATIFNSQGSAVKKIVLQNGDQKIDVSNLPSGAYYLKHKRLRLK